MLCCWGRDDLIDNNTIQLSPVSPLHRPFPDSGVITIHSEYPEIEKIILNQYARDHAKISGRLRRGALVLGMSKIGKSVFLLYLLAQTLARKQPVCIYIQGDIFAILGPRLADVYIVPDSSSVFKYKPLVDLLFLLDMSWGSEAQNPRFLVSSNVFYQVAVSSSNPQLQRQIHPWKKELYITSLVLNPPHDADIVKIFMHAYLKSGLTEPEIQDFIRHLRENFNVDLCRFQSIFAHSQFQTNRSDVLGEAVNQFVKDVRATIFSMSPEQVVSVICGGPEGHPQFSHQLVATYRQSFDPASLPAQPYGHMRHEVRSPLVVKLICEAWSNEADKLQAVMEALLTSNVKMVASLGWFLEAEGHIHILTNQNLMIYPMVETPEEGQKICLRHDSDAPAHTMELGQRVMKLYDSGSNPSTTHERNAYYVPMQFDNPLFNSFLAGEDFGMGFQMTTSRAHTFKSNHLKSLQERFEAICCKPPSMFIFVFIIPMGKNLWIRIPDGPVTRMFKYYTLPFAYKSLEYQDPDFLSKQNGTDGILGDVERDDGDGDIHMT